jgi:hypothetical protein
MAGSGQLQSSLGFKICEMSFLAIRHNYLTYDSGCACTCCLYSKPHQQSMLRKLGTEAAQWHAPFAGGTCAGALCRCAIHVEIQPALDAVSAASIMTCTCKYSCKQLLSQRCTGRAKQTLRCAPKPSWVTLGCFVTQCADCGHCWLDLHHLAAIQASARG